MIIGLGSLRNYVALACVCMSNGYVLCFVAIPHIAYNIITKRNYEIALFMIATRIF